MFNRNAKKISVNEPMVDVIGSSFVYQKNFCDGKPIPHLIIDAENHPEIKKAIELHENMRGGEHQCRWGMSHDGIYIYLLLDFIAPVEISYVIRFEIEKYAASIAGILSAHLVYIQAGKNGDRISGLTGEAKLILEIPHTGFEKEWDKIYRKKLEKDFKKMGVKRRDLDNIIDSFLQEWESVINRHFK